MSTTLIIIPLVIVVIFLAGMLLGKTMYIEREVTINKPGQQVFDYVKISKNHDNFSTWNMMDPEMKKTYKGTDGTVGFVYSWDSAREKNVGAGEQEIKKMEEGKSIEYELRFTRPMQNTAYAKFNFTPASPTQTTVTWKFYGPMKFPGNLMKPIMQKVLGKALESGLQNLKTVLEK